MAVNFGGFLVRTPEHVVVVDTGIGGGAIPELPIGSFPDAAAAAGVAPEDVDDVIFTHLHFDHVGWSTDGETPLFTSARAPLPRDRLGLLVRRDPAPETGAGPRGLRRDPGAGAARAARRPITLHDGERTEIVPGVTLRLAPGHTPGHCIVEDSAASVVLLADAAHNPAQLLSDDWTSATDVDPELARRDARRAGATSCASSGALIAMTHHPRRRPPEVEAGRDAGPTRPASSSRRRRSCSCR